MKVEGVCPSKVRSWPTTMPMALLSLANAR
jgi:hypothetical protein